MFLKYKTFFIFVLFANLINTKADVLPETLLDSKQLSNLKISDLQKLWLSPEIQIKLQTIKTKSELPESALKLSNLNFQLSNAEIQEALETINDEEKSVKFAQELLSFDSNAEIQNFGWVLKLVLNILKAAFHLVVSCLLAAAKECLHLWRNPKALIRCAVDFFKRDKGACILG